MNDITLEKIVEIITSVIEDIELTIEDKDEDLMQLGLDSIGFIQIVVALEEQFACEIPDEKLLFSEMNTVHKIFNVLQSAYTEN